MARSNGHNGQGPAGLPHWPTDGSAAPGHAPNQPQAQQAFPQQGFTPSPDLPPYPPQSPLAAYAPQARPPQAAHGSQPTWPQEPQAQRSYDLGQFGHIPSQTQPPAIQPHTATHDAYGRPLPPSSHPGQSWHPGTPLHAEPGFPPPSSFAEPVPTHRPTQPPNQAHAPPYGQPYHQQAHPQPQPEAYEDEYEEEFEDEDEPKRGRKLMVVGALVGAICVGAGLAYAYRAFSGGKTPLVASQKGATQKSAQVQPQKAPAKLPEAVPNQALAAASTPDDGVRRVTSISIPPPGTAVAVAPSMPSPPPSGSATVMPGMVLDGPIRPSVGIPNPLPVTPPATAQAAPLPPPAVKTPPAKIAVLNPVPAPQAAAPQTPPAPERKAAPVPKTKSNDAFVPGSGATASTPAATAPAAPAAGAKSALGAGNGYVATVLSTQRGRPEAMKAFADLQQKFPDVLGTKPAEVQEKNLGDKGVWYRAVVGPPASRAAATEVCTQLKASGYLQCFVTAY